MTIRDLLHDSALNRALLEESRGETRFLNYIIGLDQDLIRDLRLELRDARDDARLATALARSDVQCDFESLTRQRDDAVASLDCARVINDEARVSKSAASWRTCFAFRAKCAR